MLRTAVRWFVSSCFIVTFFLCCGCAHLPEHMTKTTRLSAPPPGKALINFHRPTGYGGEVLYPIFLGDGTFIADLPGESIVQYVSDPGKRLFYGWMEHVSVIEADVAADRTYDFMVDVQMGWMKANISLNPMRKGDPRRAKLAEFEKREKNVLALQRTRHATRFEQENQTRIQEIKRDFLGGEKSYRVEHLGKDDCR